MSKGIAFFIGMSLIGFMACGGGGTKPPPPPTDNGMDTAKDAIEVADPGARDIPGNHDVKQDGDVTHDRDAHPSDTLDIKDDGNNVDADTEVDRDSEQKGETTADIPDDGSADAEAGSTYNCVCNENENKHPVCGLDKTTTYPNDSCALCDQCASIKGHDKCIGCTGTTKDCDPDDWTTYISEKVACSGCLCTSDERHSDKVCGKCDGSDCCNVQGFGSAKTYSNLCELKTAIFNLTNICPDEPKKSAEFFSMGECVCASCPDCENKPKNPVCGFDGNTYPNKCWLLTCPEGASTRIQCAAACLDTQKCPTCASDTECAPVCGDVNGSQESFYNECAATCAGATIKYKAACCMDCVGTPKQPICTKDSDGNLVTLANSCELNCLVYTKLYDGACSDSSCEQGDCSCSCAGSKDCACDCTGATGNDLVCGGEYGTTWPSQCWLDYMGLAKIHDGKCNPECESCSSVFAPVCSTDNKTYANDCLAKCKGATVQSTGVCSGCKTLCGTADNPKDTKKTVCGSDGVNYPTNCFPNNCTNVTYREGDCE